MVNFDVFKLVFLFGDRERKTRMSSKKMQRKNLDASD